MTLHDRVNGITSLTEVSEAGEVTNSSCSNTTNGLITLENDHLELQTIKAQKSSVHATAIEMIDNNDDQGDIGSES